MRIVCWQTILLKNHTLFLLKIGRNDAKFVVCCSPGLSFFCQFQTKKSSLIKKKQNSKEGDEEPEAETCKFNPLLYRLFLDHDIIFYF